MAEREEASAYPSPHDQFARNHPSQNKEAKWDCKNTLIEESSATVQRKIL